MLSMRSELNLDNLFRRISGFEFLSYMFNCDNCYYISNGIILL
jgi:hypothetical protein